nr:MAG TPA: hypothetical protein [Caudoviricetes sp.]
MFVTFYDKDNKEQVAFMVELQIVPCIGDSIMIGKKKYKVIDRMFSVDKTNRCCCYVK